MNEHFKIVAETLIREGFKSVTETSAKSEKEFDFNITPYSLNTKLSFKFNNLEDFTTFLKIHHDPVDLAEKTLVIQTTLMELGLDPKEFFYVNFFERGKSEEM